MALFNYRAKDNQGVMKKGIVEAPSVVAASEILHGHGLTVLALKAEDASNDFSRYLPFLNRVSRKELVIFSRQLSTLINAKVPIVQALDILSTQVTSKILQNVTSQLVEEVEGGKSFSEAISGYPRVFSDLYVHLVKSGELSGTLDQALIYIADQQEKDYDLVSKVRGAMTYPIFIVSAILIVGTLMFVFVLPQMIGVLKESGAQLPFTTKILIGVTNAIQHYWALIVILLVGGIGGSQVYIRTAAGRAVWDRLKLRLPVFGKLLRNIYMDRLALNLSSLVAGGIPIVQALQTTASIVGNTVYKQIILNAAAEVETGKPIASVFQKSPEIPRLVTQMVRIGEQTGSLDQILAKLAKFYDKEVANTLSTLTTLLEPMIMILLGLAVGVMVAGILLPIYNLASAQ